jgi:hypothetical protein
VHVFIISHDRPTKHEQAVATAAPHGCFIDHQANVWIGGNYDGIVQKQSHDESKLSLQIGTKGKFDTSDGTAGGARLNSSHVFLNAGANMAVDSSNRDVYIAVAYRNYRL